MQKFNQSRKPKFKLKQKQLRLSNSVSARRGFKKFRLFSTSLDRLRHAQRGALRLVQRKTTKSINNALSRQSLRFVGPTGTNLVRQAAGALRRSLIRILPVRTASQKISKSYTVLGQHSWQRSPYLVGQKYRLKLVAASAGAARLAPYLPARQRLRVQPVLGSVRGRYLAYAHARSVVRVLTFRRSLALRSFRGKRRMRQR